MTLQAQKHVRPPRRRDRSFTDVITGLAAIAALLVLITGIPLALITVFGLPVPHAMPRLTLLTHRLDVAAVLRICSIVVWLAWLQLVWCVIVEVTAAVRNTGMPARVPLAGGTQALVHRLVTAALLLTAAAALSPALAHHSARASQPAAGQFRPGPGHAAVAAAPARPGQAAHSRVDRARLVAGEGPGVSSGPAGPAAGGRDGANFAEPGSAADVTDRQPAVPLGADGHAAVGDGYAPAAHQAGTWAGGTGAAADPALAGAHGPALHAPRTEKIYVVKPPEGRFHESLWEIAERHLGDGRRYREIFDLNAGRPQPDGSALTIASLIRPGWTLVMPADAHGPGIEVITPGHPGQHGNGHGRHGRTGPGHPVRQHPVRQHPAPPPAHPRHELTPGLPAPPPKSSAQPTPGATAPAEPTAPAQPTAPPAGAKPAATAPQTPAPARRAAHGGEPAYPLELAGAALLAAGVLYALRKRRRRQLGRRAFGRRLAMPAPDAAWAEAALLLGEDEPAADLLDTGLRYLGWALTEQGRTPPTVFAAHVGEENVDLWVAPADTDAPAPWYAVGDGQVWRLPLAAVPSLRPGLHEALAPYPGLVSIGTDATGRVLVDVASAHGLITVSGPDQLVHESLTAMATELAISRWSEGIHLTLVGFGADLAVLAPDRVHLVPTLAEALPDLETWAAEVADASSLSAGSGQVAGAEGMRVDAWEPHYLITAVSPSSGWERDRLLALARTGRAAGAGYVAAGDVEGAAWTWQISPEGRLRAAQLGLEVLAQHIPHEQQVALLDLVEATGDLAGEQLSAPLVDAAPAEHLVPGAEVPVEVTLLGPLGVRAASEIEPGRLAIATEVVVYLAAHPGGVHPNVLSAAIWPRGVTPEVRDALLDRVSGWLGTDGIGRPHLAADATGRLRLGSGVRVDWHVFSSLVALAGQAAEPGQAPAGASVADGGDAAARQQLEETLLAQALGLVGGPFMDGRERGRYSWLAADGLEFEVQARVADAAHRLCELRLAGGDPDGAMEAANTGLRLAPHDELLWRDLLTAAHATGEEEEFKAVVGEICEWARLDGGPGMAPETEALIDELLPSWRWSIA